MKVELAIELASLRGGSKNGGLVFTKRKGITFARSKALSVTNPQTADQIKIRAFVTAITKTWKDLTEVERQHFFAYIETYYPRACY